VVRDDLHVLTSTLRAFIGNTVICTTCSVLWTNQQVRRCCDALGVVDAMPVVNRIGPKRVGRPDSLIHPRQLITRTRTHSIHLAMADEMSACLSGCLGKVNILAGPIARGRCSTHTMSFHRRFLPASETDC
jgi:hypothetical protein